MSTTREIIDQIRQRLVQLNRLDQNSIGMANEILGGIISIIQTNGGPPNIIEQLNTYNNSQLLGNRDIVSGIVNEGYTYNN